ncbi:MAG: hypothetical protein ABL949_13860 [Fimbriimonadaceae bacterium]
MTRKDVAVKAIRQWVAESTCIEEHAAKHGRRVMLFSLDEVEYSDPEIAAWMKRFGEILNSRDLLTECEERFLVGDELKDARKLRRNFYRRLAKHERRQADGDTQPRKPGIGE